MTARFGLLTVSDRASRGEYDDLGGPAMAKWLSQHVTSPHIFVKRIVHVLNRVILPG